jgi:hypothetical protein
VAAAAEVRQRAESISDDDAAPAAAPAAKKPRKEKREDTRSREEQEARARELLVKWCVTFPWIQTGPAEVELLRRRASRSRRRRRTRS